MSLHRTDWILTESPCLTFYIAEYAVWWMRLKKNKCKQVACSVVVVCFYYFFVFFYTKSIFSAISSQQISEKTTMTNYVCNGCLRSEHFRFQWLLQRRVKTDHFANVYKSLLFWFINFQVHSHTFRLPNFTVFFCVRFDWNLSTVSIKIYSITYLYSKNNYNLYTILIVTNKLWPSVKPFP